MSEAARRGRHVGTHDETRGSGSFGGHAQDPLRLLRHLPDTPRKAALAALCEVDRGAPVQAALSRVLDAMDLEVSPRRQATDLLYTYLRMEIRVRHVLAGLLPRPGKLPPLFLSLLSLAVSSLLFQEHAPAHAVVDGAVRDTRAQFGRGLDRVCNGVLRAAQRLGSAPHTRDFYRAKEDRDPLSSLFRFYSLPEPIGRLWVAEHGPEIAETFMIRSLARPSACLRVNARRAGAATLADELASRGGQRLGDLACGGGPALSMGVLFPEGAGHLDRAFLSSLRCAGRISWQSAGSQLALDRLGVTRVDGPLWDACAGFGGKTTALLEQGIDVSMASDMSWQRLSSLPAECERLGLWAPSLFLADASRPPLSHVDGCVLLDVPCSGLGVLARRPDIRRRPFDPLAHARVQEAVLEAAARLVRPGAAVFYVTCTLSSRENGAMTRAASRFGLELVDEWQTPPDMPIEGMYAARLRRR